MLVALLLFALQAFAPPDDGGEPDESCASALQMFREAINPSRAGDAAARRTMLERAEFLAQNCGRPECLAVANYYAGFDDTELAAGMAIESRVQELRAEYDRAYEAHLDAEGWRALLPKLVADADAIADDGARAAEWAAGLRARSFAGRLRVEAAQLDPDLEPEGRAALLAGARADLEAALAGFERVGQIGSTLEPRWRAGRLAQLAGRHVDARECFERCRADAEHVGRLDYAEFALQGLLALARDAGDLQLEERALAALARLRPGERSWQLAANWAVVMLGADHTRAALNYLERNAPPAELEQETSEWHQLAGSAALRARDLPAARRHLEAALAGRTDPAALLALARLEFLSHNPDVALDLLERALDTEIDSRETTAHVQSLLGELALASGNVPRARDHLLQALAAARSWEAFVERDPLDPQELRGTRNVFGEWLGVHTIALLALTLVRGDDALEAARIVEELQSRGLRKSGTPASELRALAGLAPAELSQDDVRAWAASHRAGLVTWVIGPDFGVALHVAADGRARAARVELGRAQLTDLVRRFDEALVFGDAEWSATLARELARALLPEPLASTLAAEPEGASLLCLPHGALERLALERLVLDGRALEERFVVSVLPGLVAPRPRAAIPIAGWTLLGAPSASRARALPSARAELETLARNAHSARLAVDADCTRDALLGALVPGAALHIATHALRVETDEVGRFAPVGLEVAGGQIVGADEIRRHAGALELVVLSSCASAEGRMLDAEGLHGIARAFLEAGARDVVATLRPVSDRAAHDFALAFQRGLDRGETRAAAVRAARRELAEAGLPLADWTAFRLLGQD